MSAQQGIEKVGMAQFVNFRLRDGEFGVDVASVREITRVTDISTIPEAPAFIIGVANLRGQIIPVIDLARQFGLAPLEKLPDSARIVVSEVRGQTVGLLVDAVPEVLRIEETDIEPTPELIQMRVKRDYVKGVGKQGDRLIVILDLEKVLASSKADELASLGAQVETSGGR